MSDPVATTSQAAVPTPFFFHAADYIIRGEDPQQLEALFAGFQSCLRPQGPVEQLTVFTMVLAQWSKQRWGRFEVALMNSAADALSLLADPAANRTLLQVERRIAHEERRYTIAFADLRRLQKERAAAQPSPEPPDNKIPAENRLRSAEPPLPPHPPAGRPLPPKAPPSRPSYTLSPLSFRQA